MKGLFQLFAFILVVFGVLGVASYAFDERAVATGHTEVAGSIQFVNEDHSHHDSTFTNYSVFRKGRYIHIITGLAPMKILEHDGQLMTVHTVVRNGSMPLQTYRPASPEHAALWHRYFG